MKWRLGSAEFLTDLCLALPKEITAQDNSPLTNTTVLVKVLFLQNPKDAGDQEQVEVHRRPEEARGLQGPHLRGPLGLQDLRLRPQDHSAGSGIQSASQYEGPI